MSHVLRATALCAVLLVSGCAGSEGQSHTGHAQKKTSPSAEKSGAKSAAKSGADSAGPASLTKIADAIGCKANVVTDAEELRQAACKAGKSQYTVVTFATDKGKRAWLSESKDYGGTYLVGYRWSVTAPSEDSLKPLRVKLGGTIETGTFHGGMEHGGTEDKGTEHDGMDMESGKGHASHAQHH
ncbi:hypothetical protein B7755_005335 [Streptomyces sp. NBS 14/10]|uniref:hypothetical protein n=1 Tax=Streptomyces sp. NBS 14/10 TaxID=1945643 RepID=UPI000B7F82A1|nr:hypothetical protein [Streptomyces sp. NBS 14/10]KAK1177644.1 hypothetical protein B7755_005335 [Streptomyces sp. NBS 14/10]NUP39829.1 hypothetical protein [Streptomyces sp.]NUS90130.1 hypothetical protein [Streptomyces sp.]